MSTLLESLKNLKSWLIIAIFIVIIIGLVKSLVGFTRTQDRFDQAEKEVAELEKQRLDLQSQLTLEDSTYVTEEQLRDSLGLSRPGEMVVVIPEELLEETMQQKRQVESIQGERPHWQKWLTLFVQ